MRNKISILVPTDFSENAMTAYRFALKLAEYLNASIKLIHVNTEILTSSRPSRIVQYPQAKSALKERLNDIVKKENLTNKDVAIQTQVETEVVEGITLVGEIVRQSEAHDLVVVGAKGENLTSKKLFGSIPTLLSQKANVPVLVIPNEAEFYAPSKILFASNWESCRKETVQEFIQWATIFNAQVNFIHIAEEYAIDNYDKVREELFNTLEEKENLGFSYLISKKEADSPLEGILEYANEEEMDWIVVANRQKGFFNNILGLSMSKELTTNPRYPTLVLKFKY